MVGTPIGNLEDMTFRAVRTLREVSWVAAEDTRHTRKLLAHFEISARLVSYHEHNKQKSGPELIRKLLNGEDVALVSDAGLPAISDPGYELVRMAVENDITVVPIPGANAALTALIASGLPTASFSFAGFLPRDNKSLRQALERWKNVPETLILYESPHRIIKTLSAMYEVWGDRRITLARELTKKHEQFVRGTIRQCLDWLDRNPPLGEFCIIVEGAKNAPETGEPAWWAALSITEHVEHYIREAGLTQKEAIRRAAEDRGLQKREVYNRFVAKKAP